MINYRITKYNPKLRENGKYLLDEWTSISDVGKVFSNKKFTLKDYEVVENYYVNFISQILNILKVDYLTIKQYEDYCGMNWKTDQTLNKAQIEIFMKDCLREKCWGKLEAKGFFIHFGYDYYMYIGTDIEKEIVHKIAVENNLFDEECVSPYND